MAMLIAMALSWLGLMSAQRPERNIPATADSLTVSLVTCFPGPEIYELCGHEAIRIQGLGRDSIWNFGLFDFNQPNFVYRFVKGETDYMGAGYPFEWFMPEYIRRGSKVVEQELNLTQPEAHRLLAMLQTASLPENRTYRYSYISNNCATRITSMIDSASSSRVIYPDSVHYGTFRNEMRHYHRDYPWYQFGIDLALGSGLDRKVTARDEMFTPIDMMRQGDGARFEDGRPFVRRTNVLYDGVEDPTLGPTPWYFAPLFWSWVWFAVSFVVAAVNLKTRRLWRWYYSLWFTLLGLAGLLVAFLVFISSHEATSPNVLLLWLNPLQLIPAVCLWWRGTRKFAMAVAIYDIAALIAMLVVWPFQAQSANPAFFPLMGATLVLAAAYAIIAGSKSYNNVGSGKRGVGSGKRGVGSGKRGVGSKKRKTKNVKRKNR